ncbi:MAG: hypothetical protein ACLUUO_02790 [Sellimonas intestinalis]
MAGNCICDDEVCPRVHHAQEITSAATIGQNVISLRGNIRTPGSLALGFWCKQAHVSIHDRTVVGAAA